MNSGIAPEEEGVHAQYPMFAMTFYSVAEDPEHPNQFRLGDVKVEGLDSYNGEKFYQLVAANAIADGESDIIYVDMANALLFAEGDEVWAKTLVGWWALGVSGDEQDMCNDRYYANGTGFIGLLDKTHDVTVICAGAANNVSKNVDISGKVYPMFGNAVPRRIQLKEVTVANMDSYSGEKFYKLFGSDATPNGDADIIYVDMANALLFAEGDEVWAETLVGWWALGVSGDEQDMCGDRWVEPGETFIGLMGGNEDVIVNFPAAY